MEPAGKVFRGENALRHEPRTDNVTLLDFDSMTAQCGTARFVNLPNLLQKARHYVPIQRPKDDQPFIFQSFDIEVSQSEHVDHNQTPLRIAPGHLLEDCPGLIRNLQPGGRSMLTGSLVCPSNAFFIFMGDHGINTVPKPGPRPNSGRSSACRIAKQVRIKNPAIDVDSSSDCHTTACPLLREKCSSDPASDRDVADEVFWNTHIAHALLNDPFKGVRIAGGKILGTGRRIH